MRKFSKTFFYLAGIFLLGNLNLSPASAGNLIPWSTLKTTSGTAPQTLSTPAPLSTTTAPSNIKVLTSKEKIAINKKYMLERSELYNTFKQEKLALKTINQNKINALNSKHKSQIKMLTLNNNINEISISESNYYKDLLKIQTTYNLNNKKLWSNYTSALTNLKSKRDLALLVI